MNIVKVKLIELGIFKMLTFYYVAFIPSHKKKGKHSRQSIAEIPDIIVNIARCAAKCQTHHLREDEEQTRTCNNFSHHSHDSQ